MNLSFADNLNTKATKIAKAVTHRQSAEPVYLPRW